MNELHELLQAEGFTVEQTGGGCTAWIKNKGHCHAMVTTHDGPSHEVAAESWLLGIYNKEHEEGAMMIERADAPEEDSHADYMRVHKVATLADALRAWDVIAKGLGAVDDALNAAAKEIQSALEVTAGDFAGVYFSGARNDTVIALQRYAMAQAIDTLPKGE
jgi:hypothetical protein